MGASRRYSRMAVLAAIAATTLALVGATAALAATLVYFEGVAFTPPSGPLSPTRPLTESSVRHLGGDLACTNAKNLDGGVVGQSYCVGGGGAIGHPYCGCAQRRGWAHSINDLNLATLRARVDW